MTLRRPSVSCSQSGINEDEWEIVIQSRAAETNSIEEFMAGSITRAGIPASIRPGSPTVFTEEFSLAHKATPPGSAPLLFTSGAVTDEPDSFVSALFTQGGSSNAGAAPVPEIEPLVIKARQTFDVDERKSYYSEIQQLHHELLYSIFEFYFTTPVWHAQTSVQNLDSMPWGDYTKWNELWLKA